jgi:hypothetical protein
VPRAVLDVLLAVHGVRRRSGTRDLGRHAEPEIGHETLDCVTTLGKGGQKS